MLIEMFARLAGVLFELELGIPICCECGKEGSVVQRWTYHIYDHCTNGQIELRADHAPSVSVVLVDQSGRGPERRRPFCYRSPTEVGDCSLRQPHHQLRAMSVPDILDDNCDTPGTCKAVPLELGPTFVGVETLRTKG